MFAYLVYTASLSMAVLIESFKIKGHTAYILDGNGILGTDRDSVTVSQILDYPRL